MMSVYGCQTKKDLKAHTCQGDGAGCHDAWPTYAPMTIGAVLVHAGKLPEVSKAKSCDALSRFQETSMFGLEYEGDGQYPVVGPSPTIRKWYALVTVQGGKIVEVV